VGEEEEGVSLLVLRTNWESERGGGVGAKLTVIIVIANNNLFNLSELAHLTPEILVERVKVVLELAGVHLDLWIVGWVLVEVWEQDRLTVRGLDVLATAAIAVTACADFVIETAVDLVLLRTEDRGEVVCHCEDCAMGGSVWGICGDEVLGVYGGLGGEGRPP
jgi:hypothetical protein